MSQSIKVADELERLGNLRSSGAITEEEFKQLKTQLIDRSDIDASNNNVSQNENRQAICPFCREQISFGALKCKHCQSTLVPLSENTRSTPSMNQSVHIVSHDQATPRMLDHGWIVMVVTGVFLLALAIAVDEPTDPDAAAGVAFLCSVVVLPYSAWILSKPLSNKVLPVIAMLLTLVIILAAIGVNSPN